MMNDTDNTKDCSVSKGMPAGSGKTFTLAVEYIKLLVKDPTNYQYTLAVTFTNKATQEMKQRILSKLYGIAHSLPDADDYYNKVKEAFPTLSERVVRSHAEEALTLLIHDYNRFRIETIDSFFQRVLRNLARELGLTANLQVMLNDQEVEEQAVDNIISNIDNGNDPLLSWIMDFINERMEEDKNWNVIAQIKSFGRNIFSDFYKDHQLLFTRPQQCPRLLREPRQRQLHQRKCEDAQQLRTERHGESRRVRQEERCQHA